MVEFFNTNQGFVMAVLTAVYVLATIVLVVVAQRQAALTQKTLEFAANVERDRRRPYVIFDIVCDDCIFYARLRNSGISPALNIRPTVSPRLRWNDRDHGVGFIDKGVLFLAPGRELSEPFGAMTTVFPNTPSFVSQALSSMAMLRADVTQSRFPSTWDTLSK